MHRLPEKMADVLNAFRSLFTAPSWIHLQVLITGAILCQGARRVSTILRVMGLSQIRRFEKYHRVLNRAKWNGVTGAKILLGLLIKILPDSFPILIVVDDTIERRHGKKIKAKGCYRDACRSTEKLVIKCFGLKWVCLMLIVPLPWCSRPWALPFMTILAPSKKCNKTRNRKHKTSVDWTILATRIISKWLKRAWILIGDGGFACIRLGHSCIHNHVTLISRLRLDAALYDFPETPPKGQRGRHRVKGKKVTPLKQLVDDNTQSWKEVIVDWYNGEKKTVNVLTGVNLWYSSGEKPLPIRWVLVVDPKDNSAEAFFSTDTAMLPEKIINYFVLRWNIEVTFFESRAHLGIETQRQWSDKAIARTTPSLMALFSLICLFAKEMLGGATLSIAKTAWYDKKGNATFSDVIAYVRRCIWSEKYFYDSSNNDDTVKVKTETWKSLIDQLSRAA